MSKLLIDEPPLQVLPSLVKMIGLSEAIAIQQLYWVASFDKMGRIIDGQKWVRMSIEQWHAEHFSFWKEDYVRKLLRQLETDGWLLSRTDGNDRTKWYAVNEEMMRRKVPVQVAKSAGSSGEKCRFNRRKVPVVPLTETVTETVTESTSCRNAKSSVSTDSLFEVEKPKPKPKKKTQTSDYNPVKVYIDFQRQFYNNDARLTERECKGLSEIGNVYPQAAFYQMLMNYRNDCFTTGHAWNITWLMRNHTMYGRVPVRDSTGQALGADGKPVGAPGKEAVWFDPNTDDDLDAAIAAMGNVKHDNASAQTTARTDQRHPVETQGVVYGQRSNA